MCESSGSDVPGVPEFERVATEVRIRQVTAHSDAFVIASVDAKADDEHDPEGSTIAFERAQVGALLVGARSALDEVEQAVVRHAPDRYGIGGGCGMAIDPERLEARSVARTCVRSAGSSVGRHRPGRAARRRSGAVRVSWSTAKRSGPR